MDLFYSKLIALLEQLKTDRENIIQASGENKIVKISDFLDEADFDISKAIRNLKQAIKLAGKK